VVKSPSSSCGRHRPVSCAAPARRPASLRRHVQGAPCHKRGLELPALPTAAVHADRAMDPLAAALPYGGSLGSCHADALQPPPFLQWATPGANPYTVCASSSQDARLSRRRPRPRARPRPWRRVRSPAPDGGLRAAPHPCYNEHLPSAMAGAMLSWTTMLAVTIPRPHPTLTPPHPTRPHRPGALRLRPLSAASPGT
jgi:hypothetical protein